MNRLIHIDRFHEDSGCDEEVISVIEIIWGKFSDIIQDKWLAAIEVPIAAEVAMFKLKSIVSWATIAHDGEFQKGSAFEHRKEDTEPVPVTIDPWARAAVPVRKVASADNESLYEGLRGALSTRDSDQRSESQASSTSDRSSNPRSLKKKFSVANLLQETPGRTKPGITDGIIELEDDESQDQYSTHGGGNLYEMLQKTEKQKKNLDTTEDKKDEFEVMQEEIDRATKEVKGKKRLTLDVDGKPIAVSNVEPERLPPFMYKLGLNITNGSIDNSKPKEGIPKRKKTKLRVAGSRDVEDAYFVSSASLTTSLSSTNLVLSAGVSLKTDDNVREGPAVPEDPSRPSRKTFLRARQTGTYSALGNYNNTSESADNTGLGTFKAKPLPTEDKEPLRKQSSLPSYREKRFVDFNPTEGGRLKEEPEPPLPIDEFVALGLGPVLTMGKPNPAKLPGKPTHSQGQVVKQMFGGSDKPGPRDRENPIVLQNMAHRKFGPAPPLGQVQRLQKSVASEDSISLSLTAPASLGDNKVKTEPILRQLFK